MKNNVIFYGQVYIDDFSVIDTMRDTYSFCHYDDKIIPIFSNCVINWNRYSGHYSEPRLEKGSRFLNFEIIHEEELEDFYSTIGETAKLNSLQIESLVHNVIRHTNGKTEYFLDYIIRTDQDLESEKVAKAFFDDEMIKYEKNVRELEELSKKNEVKTKKWFEFWK